MLFLCYLEIFNAILLCPEHFRLLIQDVPPTHPNLFVVGDPTYHQLSCVFFVFTSFTGLIYVPSSLILEMLGLKLKYIYR